MNDSLKNIRFLVLDVDGVLTDGTLYFSDTGEFIKGFNSLDGAGIKIFHDCGFETGIITGRVSPQVQSRADNLGIKHLDMGIDDKLTSLNSMLKQAGFTAEETAFIGDDLPDIPPMRYCSASFAPVNAAAEVRQICTVQLKCRGGEGAVRETIELILKAKGLWDGVVSGF